jgi:predicted nucleic acid-binding protein
VIHLDTSFLIRALVSGSPEDRRLRRWLSSRAPLAMSCVAWAEFLCGPVEPDHIELATHLLGEPVPFVAADAATSAQLFNVSGRRRGSFIDCMIVATAIRAGARLATGNAADFRRFSSAGLQIAAD